MPRYPIVFLDADNTLFDFSASQRCALKETFRRLNLPFSDQIARTYDSINAAAWKEFELGTLTREELSRWPSPPACCPARSVSAAKLPGNAVFIS